MSESVAEVAQKRKGSPMAAPIGQKSSCYLLHQNVLGCIALELHFQ